MSKSEISWTDWSWNPYTWNCNKVSPGCKNCYAQSLAERYGKTFDGAPQWRGKNAIRELYKIPSGSLVFVNSFSDTYHEAAPSTWIHRIHNLIAYERPDVTFQLLTKRPERAAGLAPYLAWPQNLWIGTSVESLDYVWRLDYLRKIPAAVRFVSFEPLLGEIDWPDLTGIHWAIVGGESGNMRRKFDKAWARRIQSACHRYGTAFFFKQGSAHNPGKDRLLDGKTWDEMPAGFARPTVPAAPAVPVQLELFA